MYALEKSILLVAGALTYLVGLVLVGVHGWRAHRDAASVGRMQTVSRILK